MENDLERRCPRLGGPVTFQYCRTSADDGLPCWKIIDCWWEYFDVVTYLKNDLPEDIFKKIAGARPKPKMQSLLELIQQAKKTTGK